MASKSIREEEMKTIRTAIGPSQDKARQVNNNREMKQKCKPRCSSHGHNGARSKDKVRKLKPEQHTTNTKIPMAHTDDDLSHPHQPYHNVWKKWNPERKTSGNERKEFMQFEQNIAEF